MNDKIIVCPKCGKVLVWSQRHVHRCFTSAMNRLFQKEKQLQQAYNGRITGVELIKRGFS